MVSLSSSGCLAIVKNQFLWKTSIFFISTNFLYSWSCKNGPLANQPSGAQQGVLIPLGVHYPFWSDAWPTRAQESLALAIHSKEHLGTAHYWPVIHPLLLWKNFWPFSLLFSSCCILTENALKGTKQAGWYNTCSLSHSVYISLPCSHVCHHTLSGDFISVASRAFPWGLQVILMPQGAWVAPAVPASNSAAFYHFIDAVSGANGFRKGVLLFCAGIQWTGRICLILVFKSKGVLSPLGRYRLGFPIFCYHKS